MEVRIAPSWKNLLSGEFEKDYFINLTNFIKKEYLSGKAIYPKPSNIFNAFNLCPLDNVKVVIIGQDPYHEPNQAHGLCFSVQKGVNYPPSLVNIYKEIENDLGYKSVTNGDLSYWAEQGILLLNSSLTVKAHYAGSHSGIGWEMFTDSVIKILSYKEGVVYLLWGSFAQKKAEIIDINKNLVLKSVHPSPLSAHRGFFGNHHFSKTNQYLKSLGKKEIIW